MTDTKYLLNKEAICPYCDDAQSDSWEISPGTSDEWVQVECGNCTKTFLMERVVDVKYSTEPADCANDMAPHKWKNIVAAPREYGIGKQRCEVCFSDREIDQKDWEKIDADNSHPENWRQQ